MQELKLILMKKLCLYLLINNAGIETYPNEEIMLVF